MGQSWSESWPWFASRQDFHLALAKIQLPEKKESVCIYACLGFPPGTAISGKLLAGMVPKTLVVSSTNCLSFFSSPLASPVVIRRSPLWSAHSGAPSIWVRRYRAVWPSYGITTPIPDPNPQFPISRSPFCFQTGYALCAKRPSRPFPPPFLSPPSSSFSDPLTTHYLSQDKRLSVRGDLVRGLNNGDDAVLVAENYLAVNDGVGAWATKPRGHAAYVVLSLCTSLRGPLPPLTPTGSRLIPFPCADLPFLRDIGFGLDCSSITGPWNLNENPMASPS